MISSKKAKCINYINNKIKIRKKIIYNNIKILIKKVL